MKKYLITGLVILLPLALTIFVVTFVFNFLTDPFVGGIKSLLSYFGIFKDGFLFLTPSEAQQALGKFLVLIFLIVFTVLLGALTRWFLIRYLLKVWDYILHRIPFISPIYKASQDVINTLFASDANSFKQVVMVPFPQPDTYTLGFVTQTDLPPLPSSTPNSRGAPLIAVFVPAAPTPTSGFVMTYEENDLIYLDMRVEDAFKCIVSCGVLLSPFKTISKTEAMLLAENQKSKGINPEGDSQL